MKTNKIEEYKGENNLNKRNIFKIVGVIIGVVALSILVFVSSSFHEGEKLNPIIIDTTVSEYFELKKGDVPSVILFARPGCSWCTKYKPVINKVSSDYNLPIYYVNTQNMTEDEYNSVVTDSPFVSSQGGFGTPLTLIVGNNEEIGYIDGYVEYSEVVNILKDKSLIQ